MRIVILLCILVTSWKLSAAELRNGLVIFNSAEEALPFAFEAPWNFVNATLAPSSYIKVEKTLEEIYEPLCKKFPNCKNFPRPIIMLTNSSDSASFGLVFDQRRRQSNILIVSEELIFNQKHLEFVVAHELVHYFSLHAETISADLEITDIYKTYAGIKQQFNYPFEEVKYDLLKLIETMEDIGPRAHLISSSHGISVSGKLGHLIHSMTTEVSKLSGACSTLEIQFKRIKSTQSSGNFLSSQNSEVLKFLKDAKPCFDKYPGNLIKDISTKKSLFLTAKGKLLSLIQSDSSELDRIQKIHALIMQMYTSLSQKLGGPQVRFENEEDMADLMALELLLNLGRTKMRQYTDYLLTSTTPRDQLKCFSHLNSGNEPYYGVLTNPHHEECWRIWRAIRVEREFKKNQ